MYELFITNKNYSSWSLRPWVLMRELAIDFTERLMPLPVGPSGPIFRVFSPSGMRSLPGRCGGLPPALWANAVLGDAAAVAWFR